MSESLHSFLYRTAREVNDIEAFSAALNGHPERAVRRLKNKVVGRALGRAGLWRWLWK